MMQRDSDRKIAREVADVVALSGCRMLEIGCGDGRVTRWLSSTGLRSLVAIDPDAQRIAQAKQRQLDDVDFRVGVGEALDLADSSQDLVLFSLSLHHHADPLQALCEAGRVLSETGAILIIEPCPGGELEQVLTDFDDESAALERAQAAILKSGFLQCFRREFTAHWQFDDWKDAQASLCAYYDLPLSRVDAEGLRRRLGERCSEAPLVLEDLMQLQLLRLRSES